VTAVSVSIAMATYNGEKFLEPQLASIRAQTRQPMEMVVCDDASADETVGVLEEFATRAPFEVRLVRNEVRLGWAENFMSAARLCRGDVIAWCDQDDVWMPEKLARCLEEFERDPAVVMVVHSRQIGNWVNRGKPVSRGPRRREVYTSASLPIKIGARGNATVVSRRVLEIGDALAPTLPGVFERFRSHDMWTSILAGAVGKVVLIPDVLVQYRQHHGQAAGEEEVRRTEAERVSTSAARSQSEYEGDLERLANRAFYRASVLARLAAQLDGVQPGSGRGALDRSGVWRRQGEMFQRRLELWRQRPVSVRAAACLIRGIASGDYGRRQRDRLGSRSCMRDLWHVADFRGRRST
jgi:glycosyltransferase involved in cell wall biosynthesis